MKASDAAQEPTKEFEPGSADFIVESGRVQALLPVQKVPEMQGLDNASLLSPKRNNISFFVGPNKSSPFSDKINTLINKLEQEKTTNAYLQSTRELWREWARLKRELETARVRLEGDPLPSKVTVSSSISRNKPVTLGTASKSKHREHGELGSLVAQNGQPLRHGYYVYMFQKDSAKFALFFVSEVCPIFW